VCEIGPPGHCGTLPACHNTGSKFCGLGDAILPREDIRGILVLPSAFCTMPSVGHKPNARSDDSHESSIFLSAVSGGCDVGSWWSTDGIFMGSMQVCQPFFVANVAPQLRFECADLL